MCETYSGGSSGSMQAVLCVCGSQFTLSWLLKPYFMCWWQNKRNNRAPQNRGKEGREGRSMDFLSESNCSPPHFSPLVHRPFPGLEKSIRIPVVWWMLHQAKAICSNSPLWQTKINTLLWSCVYLSLVRGVKAWDYIVFPDILPAFSVLGLKVLPLTLRRKHLPKSLQALLKHFRTVFCFIPLQFNAGGLHVSICHRWQFARIIISFEYIPFFFFFLHSACFQRSAVLWCSQCNVSWYHWEDGLQNLSLALTVCLVKK